MEAESGRKAMNARAVAEAAGLLAATRRNRTAFSGFPDRCAPRDKTDGYAIQHALHARLTDWLGPLAGYKIGCTTQVMQDYMNIDRPCSGGVFESTVHHRSWSAPYDHWRKVGVECEIAVQLSADLKPADAPHSRAGVAKAVKACMAAIEIVDDRYRDFRSLDVATLIADDFFAAGCVLGEPRHDWRGLELANVPGVMLINHQEVGRGTGAAVLGHPLEALALFANEAAARGETIPARSFVLTGSVVQTRWLSPGDYVTCRLEGLDEVSLIVADWPQRERHIG
jgi:2-oxo-3-hexenedioate decarboxylase/2-keto-4-pentenoate hydratase